MSKTPLIISEEKYGCLWITLQSIIDMDNYKNVETAIVQKIQQCQNTTIVLDLIKTELLFSSGIGILVRLNSMISIDNKKLSLVNVSAKIREGLTSMSLDRVMRVYASEKEFDETMQKNI